MVKLYGSTQHSAVQSSILDNITHHVTGGFLHKLMMYGCMHQVYVCVDIVQRDLGGKLIELRYIASRIFLVDPFLP